MAHGRVRRLHLAAPGPQEARAGARAIEAALAVASLPAARTGLVLIRRLDLGQLPRRVSPRALALRIEAALRHRRWIELRPGSPEAPDAPAVRFVGRIEALAALALHLLAGTAPRAWYWERILPDAGRPPSLPTAPTATLAAIARAAAEPPAGAVGLRALLLELEEHDAAGAFVQALPREFRARLPRAARPAPTPRPAGQPHRGPAARPSTRPVPGHEGGTRHADPPAAGAPEPRAPAASPPSAPARSRPRSRTADPPEPRPTAASRGEATRAGRPSRAPARKPPTDARRIASSPVLPATGGSRPPHLLGPIPCGTAAGTAQAAPPVSLRVASHPVTPPAETVTEPPFSPHAGLFLLVPAIQRLGIDRIAGELWPLALLHAAADRLGLAAEDPARLALPGLGEPPEEPSYWLAPGHWPRLVPRARAGQPLSLHPCGDRLVLAAGGRLPLGADTAAEPLAGGFPGHRIVPGSPLRAPQAGLLGASVLVLGRFLSRAAATTMRSLAARPGRVLASRTHIDLVFSFDQAGIGPRRAGLDLDPGWVPWLARVVAFHYVAQGESW